MRLVAGIASLCCGCLAAARPLVFGPLDTQGELHVQVLPAPASAAKFASRILSIRARAADGQEWPLQLERTSLEGFDHPRLLAWGRLEPGAYSGLEMHVDKAAADGAPVPERAVRIEAPFAIERRRALVLRLHPGRPPDAEAMPVFTALAAQRPLPELAGYCTSGDLHEVSVFDKRARLLAAVLPAGRGPWGVAVDPAQGRVYVALSGDDEVQVIDSASLEERARIRLQPGDAPREAALTPDRRLLLVANAGSNTVAFLDPSAMVEVGRVAVGQAPSALLVDRLGARAYAFNARSAFVSVIDIGARAVAASIATDYGPLRGQLNRAGDRLYVLATSSPYLTAFAVPAYQQTGRVHVGLGASGLKVDPATDLLYVAEGGPRRLAVYDPFSLLPIDFIDLPGGGAYMAIADAEGALFVLLPERRSAAVIDLASRRLRAEMDLGPSPRVLALAGERY